MLAGHVCKCTGDAAVPPSLARLRTFDIRRGVNTGRFPAPFFKTLLPRPALFIYVPLLKLPPGENREEGRWDAAKRKKNERRKGGERRNGFGQCSFTRVAPSAAAATYFSVARAKENPRRKQNGKHCASGKTTAPDMREENRDVLYREINNAISKEHSQCGGGFILKLSFHAFLLSQCSPAV